MPDRISGTIRADQLARAEAVARQLATVGMRISRRSLRVAIGPSQGQMNAEWPSAWSSLSSWNPQAGGELTRWLGQDGGYTASDSEMGESPVKPPRLTVAHVRQKTRLAG